MENLSATAATPNPNADQLRDDIRTTQAEDTINEQNNDINDIVVLQNLISDRYHVIRKLGKGSQGSVFLAETNDTHEAVAIKQLNIQSVKDWKQYDLFKREAATLERINLPHVAKLHETIEMLDIETPMALIVQDFIEGEPLQKFIANGHRFQIQQIGDILLQLLDILENLHHSNPPIIHRDIKPSNIILNYVENDFTPQVYLIDFGAVANPQVKGGGSTVVGTYGYMAPEQLMGNATSASDLYSLAIVAVYLLSGVPPEELEIQDFHVLIDFHLQHLPHQITAFLRKMLEPQVEERNTNYKQIHEFFDAIRTQEFGKIPNVGSSMTSKEKYSLDKVYSYRQPGNIVLWQELSDVTPRTIDKNIKSSLVNNINKMVDELNNSRMNVPTSEPGSSFNFYYYGILMFIMFVVLIVSEFFYDVTRLVPVSILPSDNMVSCFQYLYFVLFVIILFLGPIIVRKIIDLVKQIAKHIPFALADDSIHPRCKNYSDFYLYDPFLFIKNARKSMATVLHINYKPAYTNLKNEYDYSAFNQTFTPTWIITYGFNPPDDKSPDVLTRTFKTHFEPDFSEGDLIPILYLIEKRGVFEYVYSTPYPFAVTDLFIPSTD